MIRRIAVLVFVILALSCALWAADADQRVQASGTVTRVDAQYNEINLRLVDGEVVVVVRPETRILRYIYSERIGDIREGDVLGVTGTATGGKIYADRIQVAKAGKGLPASFRDREDVVEGTITFPAGQLDRTLAIETAHGERKLDVRKGGVVTRSGRDISVHELAKGDMVRASGTWDGSRLDCARIEVIDALATLPPPTVVEEPAAPDSVPIEPPPTANPPSPPVAETNVHTGRVIAIDADRFTLTIDSSLTDIKVDAQNAEITRKDSTRRFSDIRQGDMVTVTGPFDGAQDGDGVVKATAIEIAE